MKTFILKSIFLLILVFGVHMTFSQNPPPPPDNPSTSGSTGPVGGGAAPIGGGIAILLALGAGYGAKKVYDARKRAELN